MQDYGDWVCEAVLDLPDMILAFLIESLTPLRDIFPESESPFLRPPVDSRRLQYPRGLRRYIQCWCVPILCRLFVLPR